MKKKSSLLTIESESGIENITFLKVSNKAPRYLCSAPFGHYKYTELI